MMEFFRNCYIWVAENYKEITMVLSSAQFVPLVSALVLLYRSIRTGKDNITSSKELKSALTTTNAMATDVAALVKENVELKSRNDTIKNELDTFKTEVADAQEMLLKKLNCIIEVQSIVYSTVKDETIRNTVNSILVNAKYAETETRAKLKSEVEALKQKLAEETEKVKSIAENATETISKIVEPEKVSEFMRY